MNRILTVLLSVFLIFQGCRAHSQNDYKKHFLKQGEITRNYLVHLPAGYPSGQKYPCVLIFHGGLGTAPGVMDHTGFNKLADRKGFIAVYPDGYQRSWNDLRNNTRSSQAGIDDVGFIDKMLDRLLSDYAVDANRVYATGISNGGFMTYTLACHLSQRIAAFAPVAANLPEPPPANCSGPRNLPILVTNGTADPLVPYYGGEVKSRAGGKILSTDSTLSWFAGINGCGDYTETSLPDRLDDGVKVTKREYRDCREGTSVVLYRVEGGGHGWPGKSQYLKEKTIGKVTREYDANEAIWEFFSRFSLDNPPR